MFNVGGDLRVRGEMHGTIGIAAPWADSESSEPMAYIAVKDRSVATSGNSQRGFRIDGRWYSHIFDPRSGLPVERNVAATVVAERAVRGRVREGLQRARAEGEHPHGPVAAGCRVPDRRKGWAVVPERRLASVERPRPGLLAQADEPKSSAQGRADRGFHQAKATKAAAGPAGTRTMSWSSTSRSISPTPKRADIAALMLPSGRRTRMGTRSGPCRCGSRWGRRAVPVAPGPEALVCRRRGAQAADKKELLFTVARPTRPPGKYRVIWDGKDNRGKPVPAGEYTICVEAAREHGTYQSIRREVTLSDKPFSEDIKGNVEIRSASIEYRRRLRQSSPPIGTILQHRSVRRSLVSGSPGSMLWLHIYLSMFGLAAVLFFSVTGITLNHPDWVFGQAERKRRGGGPDEPRSGSKPARRWLSTDKNGPTSAQAGDRRTLRKTHGSGGRWPTSGRRHECTVSFKGPATRPTPSSTANRAATP